MTHPKNFTVIVIYPESPDDDQLANYTSRRSCWPEHWAAHKFYGGWQYIRVRCDKRSSVAIGGGRAHARARLRVVPSASPNPISRDARWQNRCRKSALGSLNLYLISRVIRNMISAKMKLNLMSRFRSLLDGDILRCKQAAARRSDQSRNPRRGRPFRAWA